ncbi:MAG: hypothetical protein N3B11_02935, partial [Coriobacteriia bacterium]|nr:hypothetical protein [Coriobacteriia bacterium]
MDCERAIEILVEGPGVPPSDEDRAQAEAHCAECPKCARIRRGLALVDAAARPAAPPHLVDAIMDAVREQREMSQVEQRVLSGPAAPRPPEPAGLPSRWRWQGWERRFAGFAAAAAVVIAGLVALGLGLPRATQAPHKAVLQESVGTGAPEAAVTEHPYGDEATAALDAYRGTTAAAPPFVVLDGLVYRMTDEDLRLPSSATTAG